MHSLSSILSPDAVKRHRNGPGVACRLKGFKELCYLCIAAVICPVTTCDEIRFIEGSKLSNNEVWTHSYNPLDGDVFGKCTVFNRGLDLVRCLECGLMHRCTEDGIIDDVSWMWKVSHNFYGGLLLCTTLEGSGTVRHETTQSNVRYIGPPIRMSLWIPIESKLGKYNKMATKDNSVLDEHLRHDSVRITFVHITLD